MKWNLLDIKRQRPTEAELIPAKVMPSAGATDVHCPLLAGRSFSYTPSGAEARVGQPARGSCLL